MKTAQRIFAVLALASPAIARSQSGLSIEDAVRIGLQNNPQVAAGKAGVESSYSNYRSLNTLPPITLTGTHVQGTSTAPTLTGDNNDTIVDFGETFDVSGQRRYSAASANATFKATRYSFQETLVTLEQQIRDAYWSLAAAQAQHRIADIGYQEAKRVYDLTVKQQEAGAAPAGDVVRSSIDVANAKQTLYSAEGAERSALLAFNLLLAKPPSTPESLSVDLSIDADPPVMAIPALADLQATADKSRPLLLSAVEQARASNYAFRQAELSRLPDLSIDYQKSTVQDVHTVIFSASIPIFDFGSITHSIRAAKQSRNQATANEQQTRQQVAQQVAQARSDLELAVQSAADYKREILDPSVKLLGMAKLGYQQGATGILPVIDAESTIRNARVGYINSLLALYKAQDEIYAATGSFPKAAK